MDGASACTLGLAQTQMAAAARSVWQATVSI